jgi:predicted nucleotidyltransferase
MDMREDKQGKEMAIDSDKLEEVVRRVVEVAQPDRIILFGSAVRGEMGPNSDLDMLVVKSGVHRRHLAQAIYLHLIGVGFPVDIVVVTPEDIDRYGNAIGLVLETALREGRVVYER